MQQNQLDRRDPTGADRLMQRVDEQIVLQPDLAVEDEHDRCVRPGLRVPEDRHGHVAAADRRGDLVIAALPALGTAGGRQRNGVGQGDDTVLLGVQLVGQMLAGERVGADELGDRLQLARGEWLVQRRAG
ncbi:hypothetical protein SDC9_203135 [bioreactor metagenome]|uniref:Uncharacterized protein n=1 Tax=bioreactor metagenome TaxID=1076179 RepID=A0A645J7I5_9ZZZZ